MDVTTVLFLKYVFMENIGATHLGLCPASTSIPDNYGLRHHSDNCSTHFCRLMDATELINIYIKVWLDGWIGIMSIIKIRQVRNI